MLARLKRCVDYFLNEDTHRYAFLFVVVVGAMVIGIVSNVTLRNSHEVERLTMDNRNLAVENRRLIFRINNTALENCYDVESIKRNIRQDTIEDFKHLDHNLKLLGIRKTDAIVTRAKNERNQTLRQFKKEPCPRVRLNDQ